MGTFRRSLILFLFAIFFQQITHGRQTLDFNFPDFSPKKVAIIGTGYVGLIMGSGLAKMGHTVICSDIDQRKIDMLKKGQMPIYEPGLVTVTKSGYGAKRLFFTTDVARAVRESDIVMIAVGTPMGDSGEADLKYLKSAIKTVGENLNSYKVVCIKSTVPVGTNKKMKAFLKECARTDDFDIASNPEFLRAGNALKDLFEDNPIVVGSDSEKALQIMQELYSPLIKSKNTPFIKTNLESAETIKYAWNTLVAVKVAYVNELSRFCNACGADIFKVVEGIGHEDIVLPFKKVRPGPGFGGSCLPKDTRAFISMAEQCGVDMAMIKGILQSNALQKKEPLKQLYKLLDGCVEGKTIGILGLSFKANTDDIRKSPAIDIIAQLQKDGAIVKAYDPQAMNNMKRLFPEIKYCDSVRDVVKDVDALIVLTEWQEFKGIDLEDVGNCMKNKVIVDGRNIFDPRDLKDSGFEFGNIGRR